MYECSLNLIGRGLVNVVNVHCRIALPLPQRRSSISALGHLYRFRYIKSTHRHVAALYGTNYFVLLDNSCFFTKTTTTKILLILTFKCSVNIVTLWSYLMLWFSTQKINNIKVHSWGIDYKLYLELTTMLNRTERSALLH